MDSSIDNPAHAPLQLTVSTKEAGPTSAEPRSNETALDERVENGGNLSPSTLAASHTANGFDVDIEGLRPVRLSEQTRKSSASGGDLFTSDSSIWPGQAHWREKALAAERKNRSCQCLARLDKRTNIAVKITIALLVIGVAIGVGFGISKSVH
ncbi:hypothetical protein GGR50DRAFT_581023 [Xylaria sp. CBS 124048]|nr:hypothetical protein GGR50DRAFT_581023 [Xylaria sp. CBS 124048]